jgi:hypothetical protein
MIPRLARCASLLGVLTALALAARPAAADIPPPDRCNGYEQNAPCNNATGPGGGFNLPGRCQRSTCGRASVQGPMTYECGRCVATPGAANNQANSGGRGCSAAPRAPHGAAGSTLAGVFALVAVGAVLRRRAGR